MLKQSLFIRLFAVALLAIFVPGVATAQDEDDLRDMFGEAQSLMQQEEFGEAAEIFRKITEADEELEDAWFMLGYSLHMDGQLEEALKIHKKAAEFEQFAGIANYNVGCAYALMHNNEAAIEALEKAVDNGFDDIGQFEEDSDLHGLHTDVRFARMLADLDGREEVVNKLDEAEEHLGAGDFAKAAEVYRSILEDDKRNAFATYRLGYSLHGAGELEEALEFHTRATKYDGVAPTATYNIACVHSLNGDKDEAFKHLEKAVGLGFLSVDHMQEDPDLDNIRSDERFATLVAKIEAMHSHHEHGDHEHGNHEHGDHEHDDDDDHDDGDHDDGDHDDGDHDDGDHDDDDD